MKATLSIATLLLMSTNVIASTELCNKLGGEEPNEWFAFQTCDFLTNKAITPMVAQGSGVAKVSNGEFEHYYIYVLNNVIVVKPMIESMFPPMLTDAVVAIDHHTPIQAEVLNYGFNPLVRAPIREVHLTGNNYSAAVEQIKAGQELRVLTTNSDNDTTAITFNLSGSKAKSAIEHMQKRAD